MEGKNLTENPEKDLFIEALDEAINLIEKESLILGYKNSGISDFIKNNDVESVKYEVTEYIDSIETDLRVIKTVFKDLGVYIETSEEQKYDTLKRWINGDIEQNKKMVNKFKSQNFIIYYGERIKAFKIILRWMDILWKKGKYAI